MSTMVGRESQDAFARAGWLQLSNARAATDLSHPDCRAARIQIVAPQLTSKDGDPVARLPNLKRRVVIAGASAASSGVRSASAVPVPDADNPSAADSDARGEISSRMRP